MNVNLIIALAGYALAIAFAVAAYFQNKANVAVLGECLLPLTRKPSKKYLLILAACVVLIALLLFVKFDLWLSAVLAMTAAMGVKIAGQDFYLQKLGGVYAGGIVSCGAIYKRADILSFPTFAYEDEPGEENSVPPNMIKAVTSSKGVVFIEFAAEEEREAAARILKGWKLG